MGQGIGSVLSALLKGTAEGFVEAEQEDKLKQEKEKLTRQGMEKKAIWAKLEELNIGRLRLASKGLERVGRELVARDGAVKAILFECTDLPPYAAAVQEAVGLPVFDYTTMIDYVFSGLVRNRFEGYVPTRHETRRII